MESGVLDLGAEFLKDLSVNAIVQACDLYLSQEGNEGGGERKLCMALLYCRTIVLSRSYTFLENVLWSLSFLHMFNMSLCSFI